MKVAEPESAPRDYLETLSLECAPFEDQADGRFFYAGNALMQRLDLLTHLTQFSDSVILVAGPTGSGKTTLLRCFIGQAHNQWRLCLLDAHQFDNFPERLADTLGSGVVSGETELVTQWLSQTEPSQLLVLVIDNAEQLDEQAFERLCRLLNQVQTDRVRLILFGTEEAQLRLKEVLERKALTCTTQLLELPRLSEEETSAYLMYRLAVAGYSGESPFTATEIRAICKASDGRPGEINQFAHQALLEHQARARSKPLRPASAGRKGKTWAWALASIAMVAITAYLGWQQFYPATPEPETAPLAKAPPQEHPLALPRSVPPAVEPAPPVSTQAPVQDAPAQTPDLKTTPILEPERPAVRPPMPEKPAPTAASEPEIITKRPVDDTAKSKNITALQPVKKTDDTPDATAATGEIEAATGAPKPLTAAAPEAARVAPPEADILPHREAWLLKQPANRFSLQLLGSRSEKDLIDFVMRHHLDQRQTAYYRTDYQDANWYVLMYGLYPSRQAALDALAALPMEVRTGKPWPRILKSVHEAIHTPH